MVLVNANVFATPNVNEDWNHWTTKSLIVFELIGNSKNILYLFVSEVVALLNKNWAIIIYT